MRHLLVSLFLVAIVGRWGEGGTPKTQLYVRTIPPGARVSLDGKELGISDGLFVVPPGKHVLTVERQGCMPEARDVTVAAERITRVVVLALKRQSELTKGGPGPAPRGVAEGRTERIYISVGTEVYLTNPDGEQWQKLPFRGGSVRISPDGRRIAYHRDVNGAGVLFINHPDGDAEERVVGRACGADWLDDDTLIYEWHGDPGSLRSVWRVRLSAKVPHKLFDWSRLTPNGYSGGIALSPDRMRLFANPQNGAGSLTQDLFTCDLNGGTRAVVWEDPGNDVGDERPLWSPDGSLLWCRMAGPGAAGADSAIVAVRPGQNVFRPLTDSNGLRYPIACSPKGDRILFARETGRRTERLEIWIMNADGSGARKFIGKEFRGYWSLAGTWGCVAAHVGNPLHEERR